MKEMEENPMWECHECKAWSHKSKLVCNNVIEKGGWYSEINLIGLGKFAGGIRGEKKTCNHLRCEDCKAFWR
jgi:hypothetical protein